MNASDAQIRSAITQVAAEWYAAHRSGPLAEADRAAFLAWLKASPIHIEEYLGVAALERTLGARAMIRRCRWTRWWKWRAATRPAASWTWRDLRYATRRRCTPSALTGAVIAAACVSVAGIVIVWPMRDGHGDGWGQGLSNPHGEQGFCRWPTVRRCM